MGEGIDHALALRQAASPVMAFLARHRVARTIPTRLAHTMVKVSQEAVGMAVV